MVFAADLHHTNRAGDVFIYNGNGNYHSVFVNDCLENIFAHNVFITARKFFNQPFSVFKVFKLKYTVFAGFYGSDSVFCSKLGSALCEQSDYNACNGLTFIIGLDTLNTSGNDFVNDVIVHNLTLLGNVNLKGISIHYQMGRTRQFFEYPFPKRNTGNAEFTVCITFYENQCIFGGKFRLISLE